MPHRHNPLLLPLVLLLAVCAPGAPAAAAPASTVYADMPLADYARHISGRQVYAVYALGGKRGWASDERRVKDYQGVPILETVSEMYMEISLLGIRSKTTSRAVTRYALEGEGQILYVQDTKIEDGVKVEHTGVREGGNLRIVTRSGDTFSERLAPLSRETLGLARDRAAWLATGPRKGEKFSGWAIDLEEQDIDSPVSMEYVEPVPLVWGGVPVAASRVIMTVDGERLNALVGPTGESLSGKYGGLFEFRAEEEPAARMRDVKPGNMLAASGIAVARPPGDPVAIERMVLEISGLGELKIPSGTRQHVRSRRRGRAVVQLSRETATPERASLTADQRGDLLRATSAVQSDDAAIRRLAADIAGDAADAVTIAARIVDWIGANLQRTHAAHGSTATAVLALGAGGGSEHALLFTALARAAGVPARQVGGVVHAGGAIPLFGWHVWAEIHDGHGWVGVDPLRGQVRIDPTHVKLAVLADDRAGNDAWAWLRAASELKIKVKEVNLDR